MLSYRFRGSSMSLASPSQVDCGKAQFTSENMALVDPSKALLPPIPVHPLSFLDLESFRMMLPSLGHGSNHPRSSLEYSEEESISDESASQRSSFPKWGANLTGELARRSTFQAYRPQSDARNSSGSTTSYGSRSSDRLRYSEARNINQTSIGPGIKSSKSMREFKHTNVNNSNHARVPEKQDTEKKSDTQDNASRHSPVSQEQFNSYPVPPKPVEHIPCCQSDTMHSVFEDDSDDEDVPYLKKVFTWIPKKSKVDKIQPNLKRNKSRFFKHVR